MNKQQAHDLMPLIQAFIDDVPLECRKVGEETWHDVLSPTFNIEQYQYRIKPSPKYRPFKDENECRQVMLKQVAFGYVTKRNQYYNIAYFSYRGVTLSVGTELIDFSYEDMLEFTFLDGIPFGIKNF